MIGGIDKIVSLVAEHASVFRLPETFATNEIIVEFLETTYYSNRPIISYFLKGIIFFCIAEFNFCRKNSKN